jgi:hypothetical protein
MRTEKTKFRTFLKEQGFELSPVLATADLNVHHRIDKNKNHNIIKKACCCIFGGSDTPKGGLGCITFYYGGLLREYRRKNSHNAEILKTVVVCETAKEAIVEYKKWKKNATNELYAMKVVL